MEDLAHNKEGAFGNGGPGACISGSLDNISCHHVIDFREHRIGMNW
jgi:hypothetical protein